MKFDIIGKRYFWFALSLLIMVPGLLSIAVQGFNLGIDFTGGTLLDLKFARPVTVAEVREVMKDVHMESSTIQLVANEQVDAAPNVFIRTGVLTEEQRRDIMTDMTAKLGHYDLMRVEKVGPTIGAELAKNAVVALLLSWATIIAYVTYRFEFKFAISGILALVHDVIVVLGVFSIFQIEIDSAFVAALLTIVGFSINDTIVIFDRIRENLKNHRKAENIHELVNRSIWQTMTRSVYTVLTVLFVTLALYLFGGETTKNFSLAMLIGFASGAYSSIFFASPLWVTFKDHEGNKRKSAKAS